MSGRPPAKHSTQYLEEILGVDNNRNVVTFPEIIFPEDHYQQFIEAVDSRYAAAVVSEAEIGIGAFVRFTADVVLDIGESMGGFFGPIAVCLKAAVSAADNYHRDKDIFGIAKLKLLYISDFLFGPDSGLVIFMSQCKRESLVITPSLQSLACRLVATLQSFEKWIKEYRDYSALYKFALSFTKLAYKQFEKFIQEMDGFLRDVQPIVMGYMAIAAASPRPNRQYRKSHISKSSMDEVVLGVQLPSEKEFEERRGGADKTGKPAGDTESMQECLTKITEELEKDFQFYLKQEVAAVCNVLHHTEQRICAVVASISQEIAQLKASMVKDHQKTRELLEKAMNDAASLIQDGNLHLEMVVCREVGGLLDTIFNLQQEVARLSTNVGSRIRFHTRRVLKDYKGQRVFSCCRQGEHSLGCYEDVVKRKHIKDFHEPYYGTGGGYWDCCWDYGRGARGCKPWNELPINNEIEIQD
jgi:hypothetical protein